MIASGRPDGRGKKKLHFAGILAAAWMFAFQALASSFAAGAAVPSYRPALDIFGNPLCISSEVANSSSEDGDTGHASVSDTCVSACCALFVLDPHDRSGISLANPRVRAGSGASVDADFPNRKPFPAREPGSPRSPPKMI